MCGHKTHKAEFIPGVMLRAETLDFVSFLCEFLYQANGSDGACAEISDGR
jgi:hypothetical protein